MKKLEVTTTTKSEVREMTIELHTYYFIDSRGVKVSGGNFFTEKEMLKDIQKKGKQLGKELKITKR